MKVLMLGWEYPPHISGGLGTACEGLTTALAQLGAEIDFVIPRLSGAERASHMTLIDSYFPPLKGKGKKRRKARIRQLIEEARQRIHTIPVDSNLTPYLRPETYEQETGERLSQQIRTNVQELEHEEKTIDASLETDEGDDQAEHIRRNSGAGSNYGPNLFDEVDRFTQNVVKLAQDRKFDVIHAHDWMTYPAGIAVSQMTGLPLIVHVHSLEYDRSGHHVNERIHQIEMAGTKAARLVCAVSHYTKSLVVSQHGIPTEKIRVVHNGVYTKEVVQSFEAERAGKKNPIVLFLGRITFQKGPEFFVEAATKVIPQMPDVQFVMAGSGDMLPALIKRVKELGLEKNFVFPGFLRGVEVEKMFSLADIYVMPSVSEPFGITPLEAMSYDVPVIISKQSGVSEVLQGALKIDFWDVDTLAKHIIAVLRYPEIRDEIVSMAREDLKRIHWPAAAEKVIDVYRSIIQARELYGP